MGALHGITNIKRSQVIQERLNLIIVNVQREDPELPVDTAKLHANLSQCLGRHMEIEIRLMDEIDTGGRSKFRWVISHLGVGQ